MKRRVDLLLKKKKAQELQTSTGTEEEKTERGRLLDLIEGIVEEERAINLEYTADDEVANEQANQEEEGQVPTKAQVRVERLDADAERASYVDDALVIGGSLVSRSKKRLTLEEEMIIKKQEHDIQMEKERMELEREKLELEKRREDRYLEENRRRDEIAREQVKIQSAMLDIMQKVLNK